jgi:hypothetical protein
MKITKEVKEKGIEFGCYKPDKKEIELMSKSMEEILDIFEKNKLTNEQSIFILYSMITVIESKEKSKYYYGC